MNILKKTITAIVEHPVRTLLLAVLITGLAMVSASRFAVETDGTKMFNSRNADKVAMDAIKEDFGEQEMATVVVDCSSSNRPNAESYLEALVEKLEADGRYKNIQYRSDLDFAGEKIILYLPEERLKGLAEPGVTVEDIQASIPSLKEELGSGGYIASEDGNILLVNMVLDVKMTDMEERKSVLVNLGLIIEEAKGESDEYRGLEVGLTGGMMVLDYEGDEMAMKDFYSTALITLALILLLLYFAFRSFSIPLLAVVPLLVSIIWTAGVVFLVYDSLNVLSMAFAVLILGIGVDFSIHLLTRFMQESSEHNDVIVAFQHTFVHTGKAVILGCLTTAAAFLALLLAEANALKQLGVVGAIGFLVTLVAVFMLLPALVTLRLRVGKFRPRAVGLGVMGRVGAKVRRLAPALVGLLVIFTCLLAFSARSAALNDNIYEMMPTETESYRQLEKIKAGFDYNPDVLVTTAGSESELESVTAGFLKNDEVLGVGSVLDFLPEDQEEKLALIKAAIEAHPEFAVVPWINVDRMEIEDLPASVMDGWVSEDGLLLAKIIPRGEIYDKEYQEALISSLREVDEGVTADAVVWTKVLSSMTRNIIGVTMFAVIIIFFIVYVGLRRWNPLYALLSLVPVTFGVLGLLGTYRLFGADLNFMNIALIPLVVGIGIDSGIHIIHRYQEEGAGSIPRVIQMTGKAIFLTTATTCLAFSSLLFSAHPSMRSLAMVPIIGLLFSFLGSVVFLPALLVVIVDRKRSPDVVEWSRRNAEPDTGG